MAILQINIIHSLYASIWLCVCEIVSTTVHLCQTITVCLFPDIELAVNLIAVLLFWREGYPHTFHII